MYSIMDRYELLNTLLEPDSLGSIYNDIDQLLERNPSPSEIKNIKNDRIHEINDIVVNKLYDNIKFVLEHIHSTKLENGIDLSNKLVYSYINSHYNQLENTYVCDKSLKKSVDILLNPLLRAIIRSGTYITTSCCSGRISFFEKDKHFQNKDNLIYGRSGRILYSSHSHISHESLDDILTLINSNPKYKFDCYKREQVVPDYKNGFNHDTHSIDSPLYTENEVVLKFEAFLIHVECKNIEDATHLLNLCKSVGLKQSGISSCGKKIIMAIRGNGVLEAPIMLKKYKIENNLPHLLENQYLVSQDYLIQLLNSCNQKMTLNIYQFLKLYKRLRTEFENGSNKNELNNTNYCLQSDRDIDKMTLKESSSNEKYIPIFKNGKIRYRDQFSFPFKVYKPVSVISFSEDSNYLLRSHCFLESSREFVVLYGGHERSKTKTICVCDLKNVDKGFKIFNIGENGPDCVFDSGLITDGTVFISFGGRKNVSIFSNEVYLIHVYHSSNCVLDFKWHKCTLVGENIPRKRFRHSMCVENGVNQETIQTPSTNSLHQTRFFVSGGATSCDDIDNNLLGDIWRCNLTYKIENNELVGPKVEWQCLYEDPSLSWSSGSIAHHPQSNTVFLIGGYKHLDTMISGTGHMTQILGFNLNTLTLSQIAMKPSRSLYSNDASGSDQKDATDTIHSKDDFPVNIMSGCLVRLTDDDYLLVGGHGALEFRDEIWYLNLKSFVWHKLFKLPMGTRARFGSCLVSYEKGSCRHVELWLIGGGAPIMVIFGSVYDKPLRILMYCSQNCNSMLDESNDSIDEESEHNTDTRGNYNYIGMYIVVEDSTSLKSIKNVCEQNGIFDKSRKIVQLSTENQYVFHLADCNNNYAFINCPDCGKDYLCTSCKCCSSCKSSYYTSQRSCYLLPISRLLQHIQVNNCRPFKLYSNTQVTNKPTQNPKERLLSILKDNGFEIDVKNVSFLGSTLLITSDHDHNMDKIDWESLTKKLNVQSVALVGKIEGEKRQRIAKLLYGSGDVSVTENGVIYNFNVTTNMFSKGNSSERIRIVKTYFNKSEDCLNGISAPKSELIVDLFCGIGYFSIPILKFTDESLVSKIVCIDINDVAIKYIKKNAESNKINDSRIETHIEDCSQFGIRYCNEYVDKVDRILLGLLPDSEVGWISALRALNKKDGGILHIHGLTQNKESLDFEIINTNQEWKVDMGKYTYTDVDYENDLKNKNNCKIFSLYSLRRFFELCRSLSFMKSSDWTLLVLHVQTVKHYSPHKYHQVVDLKISPLL